MKALLLHPDYDFELRPGRSPHAAALAQDLELETLLAAMAAGDTFVGDVARCALLDAPANDLDAVLYRQEVLRDCLEQPALVRELYALAVAAIEARKRHYYFGVFIKVPSSVLHGAVDVLATFVEALRGLSRFGEAHSGRFSSRGFGALFADVRRELDDSYFTEVQAHLARARFQSGVLMSAALGEGNHGADYVLRGPRDENRRWLDRILRTRPRGYTYRIADRDEAGARALSDLRDQGVNLVANALAQSVEHIQSFFEALRTELAFYVGCLNLHAALASLGAPLAFPMPAPAGSRRLSFAGLYDACLALTLQRSVVGNAAGADGKELIVVTGANQGGKSTFLRSVGLAQLMMQSGMFVGAESFAAELCTGLFTHYKREEDETLEGGKLDEELARLSAIVDSLGRNSLVLFNESFASTDQREGSEIARQVVGALVEAGVKVVFVTHLSEFAREAFARGERGALFLRANREPDGTRSFRLVVGEPLETSYGEDLYRQVFESGDLEDARRR